MAEMTKIQWATHTFNPWRGCTKVSPGCANCYAEKMSYRNPMVLGGWGPGSYRAIASESYWREPIRWDRRSAKAGVRGRVFCASLADVFEDRPDLVGHRGRLLKLIRATPNLDWLLLTKRPENVARMLGPNGTKLYAVEGPVPCPQPNIWLGTSVEDQKRADERIPHLLKAPAAVRFLSCEPLLGPLDLTEIDTGGLVYRPLGGSPENTLGRVDWVIVGGESGPKARPMDLAWARSLVGQCKAAGVACFVKQLGPSYYHDLPGGDRLRLFPLDSKGGNIEEWPEDLRVREFPASA